MIKEVSKTAKNLGEGLKRNDTRVKTKLFRDLRIEKLIGDKSLGHVAFFQPKTL